MKRIIILLFSCYLILNINMLVNATSETNVHIIYSDLEVSKDEEFVMTINFDKVDIYSSIQLVLELGDYFEVVDDTPCTLLVNSYYKESEVYVNTLENNTIRFVAFKNSENVTSNLNNIVQITLKSKINCNNVDEYLGNLKIGLFNSEFESISVVLNKSEGIKVNWLKEVYEVELNTNLPDFNNDIVISNRKETEYVVRVITDSIDLTKVGPQIVTVYIYDYTNASTIYLSKPVNVVDKISPVINGKNELIINDSDLTIDILSSFQVIDNYDADPKVFVTYFDDSGNEIKSIDDFYAYLKYSDTGSISVYAEDSSKNKSFIFSQSIKIVDTRAPSCKVETEINIFDYELDSFDILNFIKVTDSYDQNPKIFYRIEDKDEFNLKEEILKTYQVTLTIWAEDYLQNKSSETNVLIKLIDTTPPVLEKLDDLIIVDSLFTTLDDELVKVIKTSDNFTLPLDIKYAYFDGEKKIDKSDFVELLYYNKELVVEVVVSDSFDNFSNKVNVNVQMIDTTAPIIEIVNIEENKKYLSIQNVEYTINDNFKSDLAITVLLDGEVYNNSTISIIGKHKIVITAKDNSGNETTVERNFEIIKNNLIGCGLDADCYTDNYETIIYVALGILGASIIIVIIKIVLKRNKAKIT